jgi:mannose-1-phosphate guanylyltransferase/mannose-6-phosphate isomerase
MPTVTPVILSGGAGTRLWPLSTGERPKQFLALLGEPLFEATLARVAALGELGPIMVVTGGDHVEPVEAALRGSSLTVGPILVEPSGRNTAPAVVAAALVSDPDDVLIVLPSDHTIDDVVSFRDAVETAVSLALGGALVVFGATPTRPETGYGYIEKGESVDGAFHVVRFKEKPGSDEAERLARDGNHLWNCGMFVFTAGRLLEEAERHSPGVVAVVRAALPDARSGRVTLGPSFAEVDPVSIDHAVMENTDAAVVIPVDMGWSDIGSWQSVWELAEQDEEGNVLSGDVIAVEVANSYVLAVSRTVAVAGVDGLVVVETPDAVLVVPRERAQLVRDVVSRAADAGPVD